MGSVEIDGRNVGKIIGPRGATIKQLQDEYRVNISISKEDNSVCFRRNYKIFESKQTFNILERK